jgi:hypothetical protein
MRPTLYYVTGWETAFSVEHLAIPFSNFQPTTQPTKIIDTVEMGFESPRAYHLTDGLSHVFATLFYSFRIVETFSMRIATLLVRQF